MTHQKTLAAPKALKVAKKETTWLIRTAPGRHSGAAAMPMLVLLRDYLKLADNRKEARYILHQKEVLVNGKKVKADDYPLGLFDVITIPGLKKSWIILVDNRARLTVTELSESDAKVRLSKIVGKRIVAGGKVQLSLDDGRTLLADVKEKYKVRDTLVLDMPAAKVKKHLPLEKGKSVYVTKGRHSSALGKLVDVLPSTHSVKSLATVETKDGRVTTSTDYVFVVGEDKPIIDVLK